MGAWINHKLQGISGGRGGGVGKADPAEGEKTGPEDRARPGGGWSEVFAREEFTEAAEGDGHGALGEVNVVHEVVFARGAAKGDEIVKGVEKRNVRGGTAGGEGGVEEAGDVVALAAGAVARILALVGTAAGGRGIVNKDGVAEGADFLDDAEVALDAFGDDGFERLAGGFGLLEEVGAAVNFAKTE